MDFLNKHFYHNTISDWLIAAAMVLATIIIAKLSYWVLRNVLKKTTSKTKISIDELLVDALQQPVVFGMVVFGIWFSLDYLSFPKEISNVFNKAYFFIIFINVTWFIARIISALIEEYFFIYYIKKEKDIFTIPTEMNLEILKQFNANGLEFAFPTQTIHTQSS